MPSVSFMIQIDTSKELDRLIKASKGKLESRTEGIQFLLEEYKRSLKE